MNEIQTRAARDDSPFHTAAPAADVQANLLATITRSALRNPGKAAVRFVSDPAAKGQFEELSYSALLDEIARAANFLRSLGVGINHTILFLALPTLESLIAFWGAQAVGSVVPVNPFLSASVLESITSEAGARVIIASGGAVSALCASHAQALSLEHRTLVTVDHGIGDKGIDFGKERARFGTDLGGWEAPGPSDFAAFFPTGGTTGKPKLARISHRNQLYGAYSIAAIHGMSREAVLPNGLPLFHVGGGIIATTRALMLGQTLVQLTSTGYRNPDVLANFWKLADEHGFTQLITVPTVFSDILKSYDGRPTRLKQFVAGASKLPEGLCAAYERTFGVGIHEGYGMTECSGFCAANRLVDAPRPGSAGRVSPFYDVQIVAKQSDGIARRCSVGERGLIVVRGPAVFSGYTDEEKTREKFLHDADGVAWLDTGDIGCLDAEGYLWVAGRSKDLIIRGGHNIDPQDIEEALLKHPGVADAAAVAMPDARLGELPVAFVAMAEGHVFEEQTLRDWCVTHLSERAAAPVRISHLSSLPTTAMNKVFKPELRRHAAEHATRAMLEGMPLPPDIQAAVLLDDDGCLRATISGDLAAGERVAIAEALSLLGLKAVFADDESRRGMV